MYEAHGRFVWEQTASLIFTIMNIMHDPKKGKLPSINELNPFSHSDRAVQNYKAPISILKDIFVKDKK